MRIAILAPSPGGFPRRATGPGSRWRACWLKALFYAATMLRCLLPEPP